MGDNLTHKTSEEGECAVMDPLLKKSSTVVREGDYFILVFADNRKIFAQAVKSRKGKTPPVKINKRSYPTSNLVGLAYGTVLELGANSVNPLPEGEDIFPSYPTISQPTEETINGVVASGLENDKEINADDSTFPSVDPEQKNDNRHLVDNNEAQGIQYHQIEKMREIGTHGSIIVDKLIENSSTFDKKTDFSKAKYVAKKQLKYQQRCRIVRCTPYTICEAVFANRPRQVLNMREDTLGQILSHSNISAGCQVLVYEHCMGVISGALAWRMGGYGRILSVYDSQEPPFVDMIQRYNLNFAQNSSIKWVHSGDISSDDDVSVSKNPNQLEKDSMTWPCPLQDHTRTYVESMETLKEKKIFLAKRSARFARKLLRHSPMDAERWLKTRKSDSIIIAVRYDPMATLMDLLPFLAPSSPFVVYCEYIEPLTECFMNLQKKKLAINLHLSDTWMREYQVLPGRTHPSMSMTQSGGFILTGTKLCPNTGHNELDDDLAKELRLQIGGRRGKKKKRKGGGQNSNSKKIKN